MKKKFKNFEVKFTPIVIGSLGCITDGLYKELKIVGVPGSCRKACARRMMDAAIRGSHYLWNKGCNPTRQEPAQGTAAQPTLWSDMIFGGDEADNQVV